MSESITIKRQDLKELEILLKKILNEIGGMDGINDVHEAIDLLNSLLENE